MKQSLNISNRIFCSISVLVIALSTAAIARAQPLELTIEEIQSNAYPSGFSMYAGEEVIITGVITYTDFFGFAVAEDSGPWQAIYVFDWTVYPQIGDEVRLEGTVIEYYGMTQIAYLTSYEVLSSGNAVEPLVLNVGEVSQEQYESVLITVQNVDVVGLLNYGEWAVSDAPLQYLLCDDQNDYVYFPKMGDHLDSITGVLAYTFGAFKLEPRETSDISGDPIPHYALHGRVVTMNAAREIVGNAYVEILGDEIVAIHDDRPKDIPVVATGGLIFPGLIDSHNHPSYNVLDVIPFETLFTERYEWQADSLYAQFSDQLRDIRNYGGSSAQLLNMYKLAEVRALTAGTTATQGVNCSYEEYAPFAHQGIIVDNVERYPALVYHDTFPLQEDPIFWESVSTENWQRFIVHLSEGTSVAALGEFNQWVDWGMLDWRTTIIHGVPLGDPEWAQMAAAGANIVWSPVSNLSLYGATADIPGALAAGVNVALAPDWTESGSPNLLDEMKAANSYNQENWGGVITPQQFAELVTCNAAKAVGNDTFAGEITPGYRANLMVIPGSINKPYEALLRANPEDVKLTVVDGIPRYGNPDVLAKFEFIGPVETVIVGGVEKGLAIQVESNWLYESDKPFAEILAELEEAYEASDPKVCDFIGVE